MYREDRNNPSLTSPMRPMENRGEGELTEKVATLQKEFAAIDVNHDSYVSKDELYAYLDQKSGSTFDRAIADELFEHMDLDKSGSVTINEFIKVFIEAEEMLKRKMEAARLNKESYKRQHEECLRKAEDEKANEKLTSYGIAHNSMAHITILEAVNLRTGFGGPMNPYVEVSLDDQQRIKTRAIPSGEELMWDEKVTFDVVNPDSVLKFIIFDENNAEGDVFEGEVAVPLSGLKDQNMHDTMLDLYNQQGEKTTRQVHVKLQWIHSKAKYFTMVAQKWLENYQKENEELQEYERYIQTLYQPFPLLRSTQRIPPGTGIAAVQVSQQSTSAPVTLAAHDMRFLGLMNQAARKLTQQDGQQEGFWPKAGIFFCLAEILICLFISFLRSTNFDLIVTFLILVYLRHGVLRDLITLRLVALVILGSVVIFDIVWLWIYTGNWAADTSYDASIEGATRTFVIVMSFVNVFVKILLAMICYTIELHGLPQPSPVPQNVRQAMPAVSGSVGIAL